MIFKKIISLMGSLMITTPALSLTSGCAQNNFNPDANLVTYIETINNYAIDASAGGNKTVDYVKSTVIDPKFITTALQPNDEFRKQYLASNFSLEEKPDTTSGLVVIEDEISGKAHALVAADFTGTTTLDLRCYFKYNTTEGRIKIALKLSAAF